MSEFDNKFFGLQPTPEDPRDFQLGRIYTLPATEDLPETFSLKPLNVKDQADSDFCTAFTTCGMSELQEGVELEPAFSFALSKEISGDPETWGQNTRDALKAHVKYGAIETSDSPYSIRTKSYRELRRIENWQNKDKLIQNARKHAKESYVKVTGPYDQFDNIRAAIWKFREEKRAVTFGTIWSWRLSDEVIGRSEADGFGHMMYVIGWKEINGDPHLIVQNSYGSGAGDNGKHYFPREVVNATAERYGSYMFIDMRPEDAKYHNDNGVPADTNWLIQFIYLIINFFKRI